MKHREITLPYPELASKSSTTYIFMNVKLPALTISSTNAIVEQTSHKLLGLSTVIYLQ